MAMCDSFVIVGKKKSNRPDDYLPGLYLYSVYFRVRMYAYSDGRRPIVEKVVSLGEFNVEYPIEQEVFEVDHSVAPTVEAIRAFTKEWVREHFDYQTWDNNIQLYVKDLLCEKFQIKIRTQTKQKLEKLLIIGGVILALMIANLVWVASCLLDVWARQRADEEYYAARGSQRDAMY